MFSINIKSRKKDKLCYGKKSKIESLQNKLSIATSEMKEKDKLLLDQNFDVESLEEKLSLLSNKMNRKEKLLHDAKYKIKELNESLLIKKVNNEFESASHKLAVEELKKRHKIQKK